MVDVADYMEQVKHNQPSSDLQGEAPSPLVYGDLPHGPNPSEGGIQATLIMWPLADFLKARAESLTVQQQPFIYEQAQASPTYDEASALPLTSASWDPTAYNTETP